MNTPSNYLRNILYAIQYVTLILGVFACARPQDGRDSVSDLAQILMNKVPGFDYDAFSLKLSPGQGSTFALPRTIYPADEGRLDIKVPAGAYDLELELLRSGRVVVTSSSCPNNTRVSSISLQPGPNNLDVPVCPPREDGDAQPGLGGKTFSIVNNQLMDPAGKPFLIRGINTPHAYYLKESKAATARIKELGFNAVRIVWCADNLVRSERCDTKDMHSVTELRDSLAKMRAARLVSILNLQNATGSDSIDDLDKMVTYLTRADVKSVLMEYQDILLINIANEWYGTWDKTTNYIEGYRKAIKRMRAAGLPHVLLIDARGYGQDVSSIAEHGKELVGLDANLMISGHLYDVYGTPDSVRQVFAMVRNQKLPFVIGEFSCSHGANKSVACETIMIEASRPGSQYGYIGWSYTGNSSYLQDLDVVKLSDWSTLTPWGIKLLSGAGGVKSTSVEACYFGNTEGCRR